MPPYAKSVIGQQQKKFDKCCFPAEFRQESPDSAIDKLSDNHFARRRANPRSRPGWRQCGENDQGPALVDHRARQPRHDHELPRPQLAGGTRAAAQASVRDEHPAVLLCGRGLPSRLHRDAANLRAGGGHPRAAARLRAVRRALVAGRHGARFRQRLDLARRAARHAGPGRGGRDPGRHEGGGRMVSRSREIGGRRLLQCRYLPGRRARTAGGGVPVAALRLAVGFRGHRRDRPRVGSALVRVLSLAGQTWPDRRGRAGAYPRRPGELPEARAPPRRRRARRAPLLGNCAAALLRRTRLANLLVLDSALPGDRAQDGSGADRRVRLDAVSRRRSRRYRRRLPVTVPDAPLQDAAGLVPGGRRRAGRADDARARRDRPGRHALPGDRTVLPGRLRAPDAVRADQHAGRRRFRSRGGWHGQRLRRHGRLDRGGSASR